MEIKHGHSDSSYLNLLNISTQNRYTFGTQIKKIPALTYCFKNTIIKYTPPTAGAKNLNKINDLLDFWPHLCVEQKVIKCYKVFLADLARISADFGAII